MKRDIFFKLTKFNVEVSFKCFHISANKTSENMNEDRGCILCKCPAHCSGLLAVLTDHKPPKPQRSVYKVTALHPTISEWDWAPVLIDRHCST